MRAYATARVIKGGEKRLAEAIRHAVRDEVWWAGVLDSECGKQGAVQVGEWDSADPRSCIRCARIVAREALIDSGNIQTRPSRDLAPTPGLILPKDRARVVS